MKTANLSILFYISILVLAFASCAKPTDNKPKAVITDAQPTQPAAAPTQVAAAPAEAVPTPADAAAPAVAPAASQTSAAAKYILTDDSYIGFVGTKTVGKHYGQFLKYDGSVEVTDGNIETAKIRITFDMTEAETDNTILTGTLKKEDFFDVEKFPQSSFESTKIAKISDGYEVSGNLTIRGVAKGVTFPATVTLEGGALKAKADFSVDRNAWGIGQGYISDTIIADDVLISLEIEAKAAASTGTKIVDNFSQPAEGSRPKEKTQ
ncbi:MAG: YceI family protein [Candidatus Hydrogenedentota bacterium]|mgnify:CR=1 FL=1